MAKRVWILGAGFSQPLGGPLLKDLFRLETHDSCIATFPSVFPDLANHLFCLQIVFHWGREQGGYWEDAEEFLSFVDDAYAGNDTIKREKLKAVVGAAYRPHWHEGHRGLKIRDIVSNPQPFLDALDRIARRALAAECERFLFHRSPSEDEAWSPFVKWAKSLSATTDAVITFNYDRVLEMLDPAGTSLQVLLPDQTKDDKRVPVYRLHGGVSWELQEGRILHSDDPLALLKSPQAQIAIAAPGSGKTHFVARHLEDLWKRAEKHLSEAETVFFVGYSFPKSDAEALRRILDVLKLKAGAPPHRDIHLVLGAETTTATRRIAALLQTCTAGRCLEVVPPEAPFDSHRNTIGRPDQLLRIKQHPLWTQDFLGDWQDRAKPIPLA